MAEASLKLGGDWGVKEGSLLGFNDQNGNYKPIPFDFSRASIGTRVNRDGLIEEVQAGVPRIDFSSGDGSLLLEPQRTNNFTYSEDMSNAAWAKNGALTATPNAATSPSGETNATLLYNTGIENRISQNVSVVSGNTYTMSVYLKNNGGNNVVTFQAIGYSSESITITNEWARYDYTITATSTGSVQFRFLSFDDNINLYAWGAQLEEGSYPTSYIKTSGSAVTRNADVCNNAQTTFNDSEGVLYAEIAALFADGTSRRITLSDGTSSNRIVIENDETSGRYRFFISGGGTTVELPNVTGQTETDFNKIAIYWNGINSKIFFNGTQNGSTETGTPTISGLSTIQFEQAAGGSLYFYGNCKELRVYNTGLTDTELQELTTI